MMGPTPEQMAQLMAKAKPVDFEVVGGKDPEVRLVITDEGKEAVLRLKVAIAAVNRVGNDPNNGLPSYQVQTQIVVGMLKCDPVLKKAAVFKGSEASGAGFG